MADARRAEVVNEQAREKRYQDAIAARTQRPVQFESSRNRMWTGTALPQPAASPAGELIGRVRLRRPNQELLDGASEFYIGYGHATVDGVEVFSWAAPVACTFFAGDMHHELCNEVALTRTFEHQSGRISSFEDQQVAHEHLDVQFSQPTLSIARRPGAQRPPAPSTRTQPPVASVERPRSPRAEAAPPMEVAAETRPVPSGSSRLRAQQMLQRQLRSDRTGAMQSVLATLQPDQYSLITRTADAPLVVDGHPGSGKTIIAVHRAAFLAGPQEGVAEHLRVKNDVLLVGPTTGYVRHVSRQVARLLPDDQRIQVRTLQDVLLRAAGLEAQPSGSDARSAMNVDSELAAMVDGYLSATAGSFRSASADSRDAVKNVYDGLRAAGAGSGIDAAWRPYFQNLPDFEEASSNTAHLPLLAYIGARVQPAVGLADIGHIVVDEAQDVTPLEWLTLKALNHGSWTLVGDMNQRRAPFTAGTWRSAVAVLGIGPRAARTAVVPLIRGYRSTRPIIEFAGRLLEAGGRSVEPLQQDGAPVGVVHTSAEALMIRAVDEAMSLASRGGTAAMIAADTRPLRTELRRRGWEAARGDLTRWSSNGLELTVDVPDEARGLEFDSVVVVEPAEILAGLQETGRLYTSLTRANRELRVVHFRPLPPALSA